MVKRYNKTGFTLIELCIVMVIASLIMASIFSYLNVKLVQDRQDKNEEVVVNNAELLAKFASKFDGSDANTLADNRLPCPAPLNLRYGQAGFGVESCPAASAAIGSTVNGVTVAQNPTTLKRVFIGAFPAVTMEARGDDSQDAFKSKLLYAVTADLTLPDSVTNANVQGAIVVNNALSSSSPLEIVNDVPFVIISTGRNGIPNDEIISNTTEISDLENIDNDNLFYNFSGHTTKDGNNYYDDEMAYKLTKVEQAFCVPNKIDVQEYKTPGNHTWTKPSGFQYAVVEISGADGGPANYVRSTKGGSVGGNLLGGSGGYAKNIYNNDGLNVTETIVIGQGGGSNCISIWRSTGGVSLNCPGVPLAPQYNGKNSTPTRFKSMVLSGGRGVIFTFNKSNATGTASNGTGAGADYFTPEDTLPNYGGISSTPFTHNYTTGASKNDHTDTGVYGGKGADGHVMITSYTCQ